MFPTFNLKNLNVQCVRFPEMLNLLNQKDRDGDLVFPRFLRSNPDYDRYNRLATIRNILEHNPIKDPICVEYFFEEGKPVIHSGYTTYLAITNFLLENPLDEFFIDLEDCSVFILDREDISLLKYFPIFKILNSLEVFSKIEELFKLKSNNDFIENLRYAAKAFQTYPFVYYEKKN